MNEEIKQPLCKLPFQPSLLCQPNGYMQTCDEPESIARHLLLLITTAPGENRGDMKYGNELLVKEFENTKQADWETRLTAVIEAIIGLYEPRLKRPKVQVSIAFAKKNYSSRNLVVIKKKAMINIKAVLASTGEVFSFSTEVFLSPLSMD